MHNEQKELAQLLTLSVVPRWQIISTYKNQTVAEHSFNVAAIVLTLVKEFDRRGLYISKSKALELAIIHDMEESYTGDIPTPYKRQLKAMGMIQEMKKSDSNEAFVVKLADLLESTMWLDRYGVKSDHISDKIYTEAIELVRQRMPDDWVWLVDFCKYEIYDVAVNLQ